MLTSLHLRNFKGWRDTGLISLKPLTIFFGTNSGGKSSIEQFFLMLKQTVDSTDRKQVLDLGNDKSAVNLGSFDALIHRHDPQNHLSFDIGWHLTQPLKISLPGKRENISGTQLHFTARIDKTERRHESVILDHFSYALSDNSGNLSLQINLNRKPTGKRDYEISSQHYTFRRNPGRAWPLGAPIKFYGFPDEVRSYYQNADFVQDLSLELENLFRSMCYLGPLRTRVDRLYPWTGVEPESVGYAGEQTISALLAAENRRLNYRPNQDKRSLPKVVAEQLQNLGLIHEFKAKPITEGQKLHEVKVKTHAKADWVDLPDVGFGISQVLPVIVQSFYAPPNSILFIEQPELHLHPRAQANLADVLIDALNSRIDGRPRNLQLVIETHSEHFLNRLQRRIAESNTKNHAIHAGQVAAYFAEVMGQESKLTPLELDQYGNIRNWPENFFGDSMGELMAMQKAAAERRSREVPPRQ